MLILKRPQGPSNDEISRSKARALRSAVLILLGTHFIHDPLLNETELFSQTA